MKKFMAGPVSTGLMLGLILAGIGLIAEGVVSDSLTLLAPFGIILLALAAVIRVWKTFMREPKSGEGRNAGRA